MKEAITLAIKGYNAEKLAIRKFITTKDGGGFGVVEAEERLREIDIAINNLLKEAA